MLRMGSSHVTLFVQSFQNNHIFLSNIESLVIIFEVFSLSENFLNKVTLSISKTVNKSYFNAKIDA